MDHQVGPPAEEPPGEEDPSQEEEDQTFLDHMEGLIKKPDRSGGDFPETAPQRRPTSTLPDNGQSRFSRERYSSYPSGGHKGRARLRLIQRPGYLGSGQGPTKAGEIEVCLSIDAIERAIEDDEERYKVPNRHHPGKSTIYWTSG